MLKPWAKKQIKDAWIKRICSLLEAEAPGYRRAEFTSEDKLSVKFSTMVDGAFAFPFSVKRVREKMLLLKVETTPKNYTKRLNPNMMLFLKNTGLNMKAPASIDSDPNTLCCVGSGEFAGYPVFAFLQAEDFDRGTPTVKIDFFLDITFIEDEHDDLFRLAARSIALGQQLGEALEQEEFSSLLLSKREASGLYRIFSIFRDFYRNLVLPRIRSREDFITHVLRGHNVTHKEVMEALSQQLTDPIRETRDKNTANLPEGSMRLSILGLTQGKRLIEIILEVSEGVLL